MRKAEEEKSVKENKRYEKRQKKQPLDEEMKRMRKREGLDEIGPKGRSQLLSLIEYGKKLKLLGIQEQTLTEQLKTNAYPQGRRSRKTKN